MTPSLAVRPVVTDATFRAGNVYANDNDVSLTLVLQLLVSSSALVKPSADDAYGCATTASACATGKAQVTSRLQQSSHVRWPSESQLEELLSLL